MNAAFFFFLKGGQILIFQKKMCIAYVKNKTTQKELYIQI